MSFTSCRTFEGRGLTLNLEMMVIEGGGTRVEIPAAQIRTCRFREMTPAEAHAAAVNAEQAKAAEPALAPGSAPASEPAPPPAAAKRITWTGPLPDPVVAGSPVSMPVDERNRSLWQLRIGRLDRAYPWLVPAAPSQWLSIGLLLLVAAGLVVHVSVGVAGGEAVALGKSVGLGVACVTSGLLQVAFVPVNDLSIVLMLLGNVSLSLFALASLMGLARYQAVVALCVQLGFGALVFGILELVTALLGSVGVST